MSDEIKPEPAPAGDPDAFAAALEKLSNTVSMLVRRYKSLGHDSREAVAMAEATLRAYAQRGPAA